MGNHMAMPSFSIMAIEPVVAMDNMARCTEEWKNVRRGRASSPQLVTALVCVCVGGGTVLDPLPN